MTTIEEIRKRLGEMWLGHDNCEDSWYSCPLSREGCANDARTECSCDQPARVQMKADIEFLLAEIDRLTPKPRTWFICDQGHKHPSEIAKRACEAY